MYIRVKSTTEQPVLREKKDEPVIDASKHSGRYPWGTGEDEQDISVEQAMAEAVKAMAAAGYKGYEIREVLRVMRGDI